VGRKLRPLNRGFFAQGRTIAQHPREELGTGARLKMGVGTERSSVSALKHTHQIKEEGRERAQEGKDRASYEAIDTKNA
jgi:hypothetical protein